MPADELPSLEEMVVALLQERGLTLALAESCTGGGIAAAVASVPGASAVFKGGVVAYSNEVKRKLLDVPPAVFEKAGAVSRDCAVAMALGLARKLEADLSLSVTGIAGPGGGTKEKPVGLVHFALAGPDGVATLEKRFGDAGRRVVQEEAVNAGLQMLLQALVPAEP